MINLNFASILGGALLVSSIGSSYDLEKLTTNLGQTYHEVEILSSEQNGLMFRHSRGIAKVRFGALSKAIQEMYQPAEQVPSASGTLPVDKSGSGHHTSNGATVPLDSLVLTLRVSQPQPQWVYQPHPSYHNAWGQLYYPNVRIRPSRVNQFNDTRFIASPLGRQLATNQFLHATGLLPRPCGVACGHFARPISGFGSRTFSGFGSRSISSFGTRSNSRFSSRSGFGSRAFF